MGFPLENGVEEAKAKEIFDLMEKFGGYGFNKSHSAAYALVCFQTAYLKAHFPVEFTAALLTSEMGNVEGIVKFISECDSHNIPVLPPDVSESNKEFVVIGGKIRFGLVAVKNVGEAPIDAIIEARKEGGKFTSLFEFCERVNLRKVNKRVLEALIKCGALDSTGGNRAQMTASLEDALDHGSRVQKERDDPQMNLFGGGGKAGAKPINAPVMASVPEWDTRDLLTLEKDSLGFYISGHPLDQYEEQIGQYATMDIGQLHEAAGAGSAVRVGGAVRTSKVIRTKRGDQMAFVTLEDKAGAVEVVVFSRVYEQTYDLLVEDRPVIITGEAQREESGVKILAEQILPIEKAAETLTDTVRIDCDLTKVKNADFQALRGILMKNPGTCEAFLYLTHPGKSVVKVALPETIKVSPGDALKAAVTDLWGEGAVTPVCKPAKLAPKKKMNFRQKKSQDN